MNNLESSTPALAGLRQSEIAGPSTLSPYTIAGWRADSLRRFGKADESITSRSLWERVAFVCPACAHVATGADFVALGQSPERAATNCIGRYLEGPSGLGEGDKSQGCDWAAYGLLGTLSSGVQVSFPDGSSIWVFSWAPTESAND